MIIWLASYPRSGNTFFRILLNHVYSIKTYSLYNDPLFDQLDGTSEVIGHQKLETSLDEMAQAEQVFLVKTHHLPTDEHPTIYLVRDGRDSLVSYAHYLASFQQKRSHKSWKTQLKSIFRSNGYDALLKRLITNSDSLYGGWSDNVYQWTERNNTAIVKFEDLLKDPVTQIEIALKQLNVHGEFSKQNESFPSFEELHAQWPKFFRKGKTGNWKGEMNESLHELFWKHHGDAMEKLNYSRDL